MTYCICCGLHHSQNSLKRRSKNMGWLHPGSLQLYSTKCSCSFETSHRVNSTTHDDLVRGRVQDFLADARPRCRIHKLPDGEAAKALRLFLEYVQPLGMEDQE